MSRCEECKHALWDYEEYYGTTQKHWVVDWCKKDLDMDADECECFEEVEER